MTRQEAIDILKRKMNGSIDTSYEWAEAIRMAIQALKQPEPCKDTISRQAAIDAIVNRTVTVDTDAQWLSGHARCELEIIDIINALPPAQPERKTDGWIPCSERLPEERDWYLGIFKEPDTGWINPLPFICDYLLGTKTKATTKEGWILRGFTDREEYIDYYFNLECVAWMPLPEPYKEESNG